jgi:hypothetical protein
MKKLKWYQFLLLRLAFGKDWPMYANTEFYRDKVLELTIEVQQLRRVAIRAKELREVEKGRRPENLKFVRNSLDRVLETLQRSDAARALT